ncbi:MAG: AAA family ATPase [Candidatus Gastranaerophilaceae bacterium]
MEEMRNEEKFIKEGVEYSKTDIENALEFLSTNTTKNYKSDNTGEEYSILYKNNRYAIKLIYEQMRVAKGLEYENKITATSIKTSFSAYYEILPRIGNNENPNSKKNILENLKKEFKSYLNNLYPSGYDKTYEYDPFYLINDRSTDIKDFCKENNIYFWKIFENDDNLERYYQVLKEKRPANTYNSYMSSTNRLKDFFNQKYGGYINWLRTLSKTNNQEINFELIEDWAINYLGKYHSAGNSDSGTKGPKVIEEFKKLGNTVVSKFSDYTLSYCTSWQNSGKIYPYLWIQFKHKNWQDSPCSISMFVIKENGKTKLCIETEIDDKNAKSKDYENFLKTLNATFAYDNQYYWEDENATNFQNIESALASVKKGESKKIKTIKLVNSPYVSAESNRIINELQAGFEILIPRYESIFESKSQQKENKMNIPLNQILYGPPGTGKTYNTVLKAMSIIDNTEYKDVSEEQYSALKTKFDELKQAGQIEFVTFHQSYSYEEFVEGIKPNLNDEKLGYVLENGIFKNICDHAKPIVTTTIKREPIDFSNTKVFKMSLGNTLEKEDDIYDYCIENDVVSLGWKDVDFSDCKTSQDFKDRDDSWGATALERFVKWMDIGDIIIISNGNRNFRAIAQVKSDYFYDKNTPISHTHFRKVEWLYKGEDIHYSKINDKIFSQQSIYGYFSPSKKGQQDYNPDLKTDELNKIITGEVNKEVSKPHILIIDEINRGDVSKIFGELITLIEEDKRIGNKYQMKTTLPYSKESFGVPNNLYIIGTMNTADRSIALLDTALRRRFDFEEIMPRPELLGAKVVEGINLQTLLTRINERITNKYDRDHQIGHSYLMGVNTKEQLERAYKNRILPLLNEYFYNESKTVAEILNCSEGELKTSDFISILGKAQGA